MSISSTDFEWYEEKRSCGQPKKQTVTFQRRTDRGGSHPPISFDMNLFNEPAKSFNYVLMGLNKEKSIMAIKPIEHKSQGSYKICFTKNGQREKIVPGRFLTKHCLWHAETTDYEPKFDKDRQILMVAIDKDKLVKNQQE
ncbi:hypothetical protein LCGC14_1140170 [marine sediment metagenome]|uniref:Uncharacterized protein n=1 Tax=marine sediment metagenome TaxID=412755 RepID=A0A0F9MLK1_9ZZZZ